MDDSLSDFQKKKKYNTGPKTIQTKVSKQKKQLKKVKGQRDLRSLIKNKESELVSYSKNFDQVCKKSGIDVDSVQLQLAVALSKSLYEAETKVNINSQESKPLTSLEKTAKIRSTLQEYGFTVPKTKINQNLKKTKHLKKHYKLLLVSDEEKQQNISDKYAKVLAANIHRSPMKDNISNSNSSQGVFYKATNICYEFMRNDEVFYVKGLFEKPIIRSYLLRDWAEIPGRPASPKREESNFKFENIVCTQDDLDCILSGSIQAAQDIIKHKHLISNCYIMDTDDKNKSVDKVSYIDKSTKNKLNDPEKVNNSEVNVIDKVLPVTQGRSASPDLFDDEISLISDDTKPVLDDGIKKSDTNVIDFMDLTECVNFSPESGCIYKSKHSLRNRNETKRKSNDLMEITECVLPNVKQCSVEHIDLTQSSINLHYANKFADQHLEFDLTQSSHNSDLSKVKNGGIMSKNSSPGTINIDECFEITSNQLNTDKSSSQITTKVDSIECNSLKNMFPNTSEIKSNSQIKSCKAINIQSDDDFQLSENVSTEVRNNEKSEQETVVIIDDAELKFEEPINSTETLTTQDNSVTDLNKLEGSLKPKNSIKNPGISDLTEHKDNNQFLLEHYDEIVTNKDDDNCKTYIEMDLTRPFDFDNDHLKEISNEKKTSSLDDSVLIVEDVESIKSPVINEDLHKVEYHSFKSQENNESDDIDTNQSVSYNYDEYVYDNLHIYEYYNENSLHKDDTQEQAPIENKPYDNSIRNNSQSFTKQRSCDFNNLDSCASENDSNKNSTNSVVKDKDICVVDEPDNIDLTQKSDSSNEVVENQYHPESYDTHSLGRKDNISIDYDEMFDDVMSTGSKYVSQNSNKSANKSNNEVLSNPSKTSDCFELSDKEFNYSLYQSRHNFDNEDVSDFKMQSTNKSHKSGSNLNRSHSDSDLHSNVNKVKMCTPKTVKLNSFVTDTSTPEINKHLIKEVHQTPGNSEYIIKTNNVTPMLDYDSMSSPERNRELEKYGLKPFKRKRAIQLLKHLYDQTHPVVESCQIKEYFSPHKRRKLDTGSPKKSPRKQLYANFEVTNNENSLYAMTKETPDIREIQCSADDWVFQKREKAKVHSCKVPLHIAFHNYVSCRQLLRDAILRYEPVNIDVIHKDLVADGYKYNPKDLLRFMDKKCITVKTIDNNARNRKL